MKGNKPRKPIRNFFSNLLRRKRKSGRLITPHSTKPIGREEAVNTLTQLRTVLGLHVGGSADRAAAMIIESTREGHRNNGGASIKKIVETALKEKTPERRALFVGIEGERAFIGMLKTQLKKAKGAEASTLKEKITEREGFLRDMETDFREERGSGLVYYGDAEVPKWYRETHSGSVASNRPVNKHG